MIWSRLLRRKVVLTLKDGVSFRGVLWRRTRSYVVLKGPEFVEKGKSNVREMDGDVVIDRDEILFYQYPEGL